MPISFSCPSCGKRFSVPDNMVGMQAQCTCGNSVTIPAQSEPAPAAVAPQPAMAAAAPAAYSAPVKRPTLGRAFHSNTVYEIAAGVLGVVYAWPVYNEAKMLYDALNNLFRFGGSLNFTGVMGLIVTIVWVIASICIVIAGVAILCRQPWALPMGAVSSYVMFGLLVVGILYIYIQVLRAGAFVGLPGLHFWVGLVPYELAYLLAPSAMVLAFHLNMSE